MLTFTLRVLPLINERLQSDLSHRIPASAPNRIKERSELWKQYNVTNQIRHSLLEPAVPPVVQEFYLFSRNMHKPGKNNPVTETPSLSSLEQLS